MDRLAAFLLALIVPAAFAQGTEDRWPAQRVAGSARQAQDLSFPREPSGFSVFSGPQMALYKPEGDGPFPAVVLHHQCGGLRSARGNWQNMAMLEWARTAVAHGYAALVIDSLGPRGVDTVCMGPRGGVTFGRGTRDALLAGAWLRTLPYVDKERIAVAGYSWGAMTSLLASSNKWATALGDGFRFQAAVAFYPGCFTIARGQPQELELVQPDIDRPLLALLGGQDTETPADECTSRLQPLKAKGAPVEWHLYPQATHCWDCKNLNNFSKVDMRGSQVVYRYDEAATRDAEKRMFDFLEQAMPRR